MVESQLVKWFTAFIMRRLRGGTVRPDVAELAARWPAIPEERRGTTSALARDAAPGAPGRLPSLRPSLSGDRRCLPPLLAGTTGPGGAAWKVRPPADEDDQPEPSPDGLLYPEFLDDPT